MKSWLEASARERIAHLIDAGSWREIMPPSRRCLSPHLAVLDAPQAFDDGVITGAATMDGMPLFLAAQEGGFMGGAVGEVHGAKLCGLLRRAQQEAALANGPKAVLLLLESGGVRLHEANAGLVAVSEVLRAVLDVRNAGLPVLVLNGGSNGCFGGSGIIARCANVVIMSEQARLAMSGPEVIESVNGVEEFDARDKALVWRTSGGKHRYLLGDCQYLVEDDIGAFRNAALNCLRSGQAAALSLTELEREQAMLTARIKDFGAESEPCAIWQKIGIAHAEQLPLLEVDAFLQVCAGAALPAKEGVWGA